MSRPSIHRAVALAGIAVVAAELVAIAWGAEVHHVVQKYRAFQTKDLTIAKGDTVEFDNEDEFIHQIYVKSSSLNFESEEQWPGKIISIKFPDAGTYQVRCEIHPKMLLTVTVK